RSPASCRDLLADDGLVLGAEGRADVVPDAVGVQVGEAEAVNSLAVVAGDPAGAGDKLGGDGGLRRVHVFTLQSQTVVVNKGDAPSLPWGSRQGRGRCLRAVSRGWAQRSAPTCPGR